MYGEKRADLKVSIPFTKDYKGRLIVSLLSSIFVLFTTFWKLF